MCMEVTLYRWPGSGVLSLSLFRPLQVMTYSVPSADAVVAGAGHPDRQNSLDHYRLALFGSAGLLG